MLGGDYARDNPTVERETRETRGPTILTKPNETRMTSPEEMVSADTDHKVDQELLKLAQQVEE